MRQFKVKLLFSFIKVWPLECNFFSTRCHLVSCCCCCFVNLSSCLLLLFLLSLRELSLDLGGLWFLCNLILGVGSSSRKRTPSDAIVHDDCARISQENCHRKRQQSRVFGTNDQNEGPFLKWNRPIQHVCHTLNMLINSNQISRRIWILCMLLIECCCSGFNVIPMQFIVWAFMACVPFPTRFVFKRVWSNNFTRPDWPRVLIGPSRWCNMKIGIQVTWPLYVTKADDGHRNGVNLSPDTRNPKEVSVCRESARIHNKRRPIRKH